MYKSVLSIHIVGGAPSIDVIKCKKKQYCQLYFPYSTFFVHLKLLLGLSEFFAILEMQSEFFYRLCYRGCRYIDCVISIQMYLCWNIFSYIVYKNGKQYWSQNATLGHLYLSHESVFDSLLPGHSGSP